MNKKNISRRLAEPVNSALTGLFSAPVARVLLGRGITQQSEIDYGLKNLIPPQSLNGTVEAAQLLMEALVADAKILIVGDFDADGATSCAVAIRCLNSFGHQNVDYLVPNRFEFGYGLSPEIVGVAATQQPDIILTVDNGISSVDGVHVAQQLGMSVIVTDHHLPGDNIPSAEVIVNPNMTNDPFPSKSLAGVGVVFYVMLALRAELRKNGWFTHKNIPEPNLSQVLDLVALGTVADVVPLDFNNRILVHQGLQRIRQGSGCVGIQQLLKVANRDSHKTKSSDLGFAVGPRLNAAGRLDDMSLGIECLITNDLNRAQQIAEQLDDLNRQRREVEQQMQTEAQAIVDQINLDTEQPNAYVLHDSNWHQGVVGLVASRIKERTNRPVLALAPSDDGSELKGSARSVKGVHIRDLLARVDALHPELITKFGGHAMAAGLSLDPARLTQFEQVFKQVVDQELAEHRWQQTILSDGELSNNELNLELVKQLDEISPWGQGFEEPTFDGEFDVVEAKAVGEIHLKLKLQQANNSQVLDAIAFGYLSAENDLPTSRVRVAYRPDINEWRKRQNLQLIIEYLEQVN